MPVEALFANRFHLFENLVTEPNVDMMTAWQTIGADYEAPLSEYVSPPLEVVNRTIPGPKSGPKGEIPVRIYRPEGSADRVLPGFVWFHGGGFMHGGLDQYESDIVGREIAHRAQAVVMAVDYELCTDTVHFPACQIDGVAAAQWFLANAAELGADPKRVYIGGASAGGALASSTMLTLRDLLPAQAQPAGIILIYPLAHSVLPAISEELASKTAQVPGMLIFSPDFVAGLNSGLLNGKAPNDEDNCFAGDVEDLSGLAPILIINDEYDSLRASGEKLAEQLIAAGNQVELHTQLGALHGHMNRFPADCRSMEETLDLMVGFIR